MTRIMAGWSGSIAAEGTAAAAQRLERQLEVERPTSDSEAKLKPSVVYARSLEEARGWSVSQLQTLQPMSQKHHPDNATRDIQKALMCCCTMHDPTERTQKKQRFRTSGP